MLPASRRTPGLGWLAVLGALAATSLATSAGFSMLAPASSEQPALLWGVARGAGFLAYVALAVGMALGLMVSVRGLTGLLAQRRIFRLHDMTALAAVGATAVHVAATLAIELVEGGLARPLPATLGTLAALGAAFLYAHRWLTRRVSNGHWRWVHRCAYLVFLAAVGLAATAGPGVVEPHTRWLYIVAGSTIAGTMLFRVLFHALGTAGAQHPGLAGAVFAAEHGSGVDWRTGLPLRGAFEQTLATGLEAARVSRESIAVFSVAVERTDHTAGLDEDAPRVAAALRGVLRKRDLLARVGSNEFAIAHGSRDAHTNAARIAQRLVASIREASGGELTAAVGIGVYPHDGWEADSVLRCATMEMHRARVEGGDTYSTTGEAVRAA